MKKETILKGERGERIACEFLKKQGYQLLESNFRCKLGEIDLIMCDEVSKQLVFVEVRLRKLGGYGSPLESVTPAKIRKIVKTAHYYLQHKRLTKQVSCRFDVIGILQNSIDNETIEWVKNAFQEN